MGRQGGVCACLCPPLPVCLSDLSLLGPPLLCLLQAQPGPSKPPTDPPTAQVTYESGRGQAGLGFRTGEGGGRGLPANLLSCFPSPFSSQLRRSKARKSRKKVPPAAAAAAAGKAAGEAPNLWCPPSGLPLLGEPSTVTTALSFPIAAKRKGAGAAARAVTTDTGKDGRRRVRPELGGGPRLSGGAQAACCGAEGCMLNPWHLQAGQREEIPSGSSGQPLAIQTWTDRPSDSG